MRKYIPHFIKPILRFVFYAPERRRFFREISIKKSQKNNIQKYDPYCKKLIVFMVPGANWFTGKDEISGGILSICSIYEETEQIRYIHQAQVIMSTMEDDPLLLKHKMFPNKILVYRFSQILTYFKEIESILFHVPEFKLVKFREDLAKNKSWMSQKNVHVNILNQRIDLMPSSDSIKKLRYLVNTVTQTTAHEQYTTPEYRNYFKIPLHKLSVYGGPKRYHFKNFHDKESILLVSNDPHPNKTEILEKIQKSFPSMKQVVIEDMAYGTYLDLVGRGSFMLTLGEGLDFYFLETVFSGGVAFALYNEDFFTVDFLGAPGVYNDVNLMINEICQDISQLREQEIYEKWNKSQYDLCAALYDHGEYRNNIKKFYEGDYTFP